LIHTAAIIKIVSFTIGDFIMTRISKQSERRAKCPHRPRPPAVKTGPKKEALPEGYKPLANAIVDSQKLFIPKKIG
jgi:hypothetical protein